MIKAFKKVVNTPRRAGQLARSASSYVSNAIDRRLRPESLIVSDQTPHQIIYHNGLISLRHYAPLREAVIDTDRGPIPVSDQKHPTPILLVPPLGVSAWIFDILQTRSMVKFLLAHGYDVYLLDWGEPDQSHSHLSLEHYVTDWLPEAVAEVRRHSKQQDLSLVGYCLGGLLCLLYLGTSKDQDIKNLVTIASPIDFHRSGVPGRVMGFISQPLNHLGRLLNRSLEDISHQRFHIPGRRLSKYFRLFNPLGNFTSYLDLLVNMADREYVSTHTTMSRWFNDMLDYPGASMQSILVNMWFKNQMARTGVFRLGDHTAELADIECPVLALASKTDRVVPAGSASKILDVVGSSDKTFKLMPGGHAGIFAGASALEHSWKAIAEWLSHRSG